jgi:hypothetical protein
LTGGLLSITGAGTVTVTANQAGNSNYAAALPVQQSLVVTQGSQTISFSGLPSGTSAYSSGLTYTLSASASSGLPVSLSVSGPASLSGSTLTITGSGTVVVTASQAGNSNYAAATPVQLTHTYTGGVAQTITFTPVPTPVFYGGPAISLSASGGASGNPVTFSVLPPSPAVISGGNQLSFTGVGAVTIAADQAGNSTYAAATQVTQSFTVGQGTQTISFIAPSSPINFGVTPISLSATGGASGNPVAFGVTSGPGSITLGTNQLTVTGAGSVVVTATQAGSGNYQAATAVSRTIVVNPAPESMAVSCWNSAFVYGGNYNCSVTMTASPGAGAPVGSISYALDGGAASTATLASGTTTFQIPSPGAGSHSVLITYVPSADFATTSPQTENFTVNPAPVNVVLQGPPGGSASSGTSVTFTATVSLQSGSGTPTGSVTFSVDGNPVGPAVPLSGGNAGYSTSGLSVGTHTIAAAYTGANYGPGSTSIMVNIN